MHLSHAHWLNKTPNVSPGNTLLDTIKYLLNIKQNSVWINMNSNVNNEWRKLRAKRVFFFVGKKPTKLRATILEEQLNGEYWALEKLSSGEAVVHSKMEIRKHKNITTEILEKQKQKKILDSSAYQPNGTVDNKRLVDGANRQTNCQSFNLHARQLNKANEFV